MATAQNSVCPESDAFTWRSRLLQNSDTPKTTIEDVLLVFSHNNPRAQMSTERRSCAP